MDTKKLRLRNMDKLLSRLREAVILADDLEIVLGNGGEIGSIVGGIADEVEQQMEQERIGVMAARIGARRV